MPPEEATHGSATGRAHTMPPGRRREMYALLLLISVSIVGARILAGRLVFSANDQSRWSTVRALVDSGSYSIGRREVNADGSYRDSGVVTYRGWNTVDKVMNPDTGRFYSSKPPLLPTVAAAEYWVLRNGLGLLMRRDRETVTRIILLTINWLPFVLYLHVLARLVERLGTTDWGRLFVFAAAGFGTLVSGYAGVLNNHTVAAMGALFALYHCLCIHLDDDQRRSRFQLAGLFAGWTMANELPAASLAAGVLVWLFALSPRKTVAFALPALLLPVSAALITQYLAVGSLVPTYAKESWYRFEGAYWHNPAGIDLADEPTIVYAFNLLVGHTGILSLSPVLVLAWIGMVRTARRPEGADRERAARRALAVLTLALTMVTYVFYVAWTHNYGGVTAGLRWFIWLVPLWLLTMLPEADRWAQDGRRRAIAAALMVVSIVSASYTLANPWLHSWLFTYLRFWRIISYP
jgi:hypothetical protein